MFCNDKKRAASSRARSASKSWASYWQELCGKCVRDGSPAGFGLATCREAERTSAGTFTSKEKLLAIYCSFAIRLAD